MNYKEVLQYLYSSFPVYQQIGALAYKADLKNTITICKLLGNPENKFRSVHIAGTNGKGSVSHMLAAVLQSAGYKTGLFTSPHLKDFRERIRINGKMIPKKSVTGFVLKHKAQFEKIKPSFFEWTTGLAFDHFAKEKVDIAIIETGLGGRLDSTNVITPLLSIITNISYDHQNILGDTLEAIAKEKAGIIKKNGVVIISETHASDEFIPTKEGLSLTKKIFEKKAEEEEALLLFTEDHISGIKDIEYGLKGSYQKKNIPTVILASEVLHQLGFKIDSKAVAKGLKEVVRLTGLRGRWETLSQKPLIIADIAHNEAGISEVFTHAKEIPHEKLHVVFGTVNDKDLNRILLLLPKKAIYYFCKADIPRALDASVLKAAASKHDLNGKVYKSVKDAFTSAKKNAMSKDFILVTGSAFVVAEVI
jgi:dihydrofolate synthase/folylpolyglutamate synthase